MLPIANSNVKAVFDSYLPPFRKPLLQLREWTFTVARDNAQIGELTETLKWGQPSYLTDKTKSGSTLRMDWFDDQHVALFFNCQTTLVESFRTQFGDTLKYSKNRAVLFSIDEELPEKTIHHCIEATLTYHLNKTRAKSIT